MAKKQSQKRKLPKSDSHAKSELPLALKLIRLLDCKSEQNIVAGRPLSTFNVKASCETAEPVDQNGIYLLKYRVGSEVQWTDEQNDGQEGSRLTASCRFEALFTATRQPSPSEVKAVGDTAANCCWPYVRAFMSILFAQMGYGAVALPLLRIDPKHGMKLMVPENDAALQVQPE